MGDKWISIIDALPQVGHIKKYPYCSDEVLITDGKTVMLAYYEQEDWQCAKNDEEVTILVSHWMHLPEPPKTNTNV